MSVIRSLSIVTASYLIQTFFGILFYLVIARTLPVTEVGAITLFLSFGAIFATAFSLNLDTGFSHFISYTHGKTGRFILPRTLMILSVAMTIIAFLSITALSTTISGVFFHSLQYKGIVILMGVYVSETIALGYLVSILQGMQSFRKGAFANIAYSTLSMGIPIVLSFFLFPVFVVAAGFALGAGISVILAFSFVISSKLSNDVYENGMMKKFLTYVTPVFLGSLFTSLMGTVDRVILPALTNLTLSAVYSYSLTIATIVTAITSPFSFFLFPKISQHFGSSDPHELKKYTQGSLELFYFIGLPASIGATILSKPILLVLVGGVYASHYIILQIMVFSYSFFSFRPIVTSVILGVRRTGVYLYSGAGALVANLLVSLIFIPHFGIYGAVAASISAWGISTVPRMIALGSITEHEIILTPFIRIWINSGLMAIGVFLVMRLFSSGLISLFIPAFVGVILYFAFTIMNRPFSYESRNLVRSIMSKNNQILKVAAWIIIGSKDSAK